MRFAGAWRGADNRDAGSYGKFIQVPRSSEVIHQELKARGTHSEEDFEWFCSRLRNTEVVYGDGVEWIRKLDNKGMLHYVDPPYDSEHGSEIYQGVVEDPVKHHERLVPALSELRYAKVMFTTALTKAVRKLLEEYLFGKDEWTWFRTGKKHKSTSKAGEERAVSNEVCVLNYAPSSQPKLEEFFGGEQR